MNSGTKLKYVVRLITEKSTDLSLPYIGLENIQSYSGKYIASEESQQPESTANLFHTGDVLYGKLRPYLCKAMIAPFDGHCTSELLVLKCENIQNQYLHKVLLSHDFTTFVDSTTYGTKMPRANWSDIGAFRVFVPPIAEQEHITTHLDYKTAQIDSIIADKEKLIALLKEKRQAIISEAVTRGLDPTVSMKDSGVEWIGQIPAHWEVKPLFVVALENKVKNHGNQCNNLLSLSYGKIINKDIETNFGLLPESFETYQVVQKGYTILRLTDLQNDKHSLRTGLVNETGIITSAYVGLIPTMELDGCFFSDILHAYDIMKIFYSLGNGVRQSMNYKDLKRLPILVPPVAEQQKISAALSQETSKLDVLVNDIEIQISALKEYRQSIISEAVTGKIMVAAPQSDEQAEQLAAKPGGANVHFKRRVLAAKILDKLCGEPTLGHVKLEKLLFLSEYCAELDMHTEYVRHAAGPYSPKVLRSIDTQLQKAKWFAYDKNTRGSKYSRLNKSAEYVPYFDANFSAAQNATVERLVELFRTLDTERCEIVATLYGAWNDFLIDGCSPTDEQIADEVLTHWSEEKKRISKDRWLKAIGWMRKHQIVPCGYGEKTKRRDS